MTDPERAKVTCEDCGRPFAATRRQWETVASCGRDLPRTEHNDTTELELECANKTIARLHAELERKDERLAAWEALAAWCARTPQRRLNCEELFGKRAILVQDGAGNERASDWFDTYGAATPELARKLGLLQPEAKESR